MILGLRRMEEELSSSRICWSNPASASSRCLASTASLGRFLVARAEVFTFLRSSRILERSDRLLLVDISPNQQVFPNRGPQLRETPSRPGPSRLLPGGNAPALGIRGV